MLRSFKVFAALAAVIGLAHAPAAGQSPNNALSGGGVMNLIGASDVVAMMGDFGVSTRLMARPDGGAPVVIASTPSGAAFIFHLIACADEAQASGCQSVLVTTGMPSAGVTYEDINTFHGQSAVTTAVNVPTQQVVLFGRHILVVGGHSRDLFSATVALFLHDVGTFAQSRAGASAVSFLKRRPAGSKISGLQDGASVDAPVSVFGLTDISAEIGAAIANTNDVSFAIDD